MLDGGLVRLIKVGTHLDWWRPLHVGLHRPYQGDRPSGLEMGRDCECAIGLFVCDDVLCLTEVGGVALLIETSDDESPAWSPAVFPGDKDEGLLGSDATDANVSIDDWDSEWSIWHVPVLPQELVVEGELMNIVDAVGVLAEELVSCLLWGLVGHQLLQG